MEKKKVKTISDNLSKYSYFDSDKDKYITITEWANGEGWDININDTIFSLHHSYLEAINYLIKVLDYESE